MQRFIVLSVAALSVLVACADDAVEVTSDASTPDAGGAGLGSDCVPYDDDCVAETYCEYADGRAQCVAAGTTARDERCETGGDCTRGSVCIFASDLFGRVCQQPCPLEQHEWCDIKRHTCFTATGDAGEPLSFGVCRY